MTSDAADVFVPSRLIRNAHAQTLYGALLRRTPGPRVVRERLELADGDFLDVDRATPDEPAEGQPWVLVLHGLEGSSSSPYARGVARLLLAQGIEALLLNYRGCSGEPNRLPRSYHSGGTDDVREALAILGRQRPGRPLGIVGFSIGANLTMKLLGESEGAPPGLVAAVGVSPPYDLELCARHLDRPGSFLYREHLLATLRRKALEKIQRFPGLADERAVRAARTFEAFDGCYTAPIHGFAGAHDYWERSSGARYLGGVASDLLLISAIDDPFFPDSYVPEAKVRENARVRLLLAPAGGHVGFVAGSPFAPRYWAEERAAAFLAQRLLAHPKRGGHGVAPVADTLPARHQPS